MSERTSRRGLWLTLIALELFVAVNALTAGVALAVRPDGSALGLPLALLAGTPFRSFRVPGLLLALAVGATAAAAAGALGLRARRAPELALVGAVVLAGWITAQAALIGFFWLQPVLLGIAIVEGVLASRLGRARARGG